MTRVAVYRYIGKVWYDSLAEVVEDFTTGQNVYTNVFNGKLENRLDGYIGNVVLYNVRYRDIYRAGGADALYPVLFKEAPALRQEKNALHSLEKSLDYQGKLGNYNIQCLSVDDSFCVHGHVFHGLADVRKSVNIYMRQGREPFGAKGCHPLPDNLHVLCNYMPYPIFDSSDWGDNREYCNYFFTKDCFSSSKIARIQAIPARSNFCKAHEQLTCVNELPLLYCDGDKTSMLLVTPKG